MQPERGSVNHKFAPAFVALVPLVAWVALVPAFASWKITWMKGAIADDAEKVRSKWIPGG